MAGELDIWQQPTTTTVVKDHGDPMSMAEFQSWLDDNLSSGSITAALRQAAFLICADVIAQDISKATLRLRKRLPNGTSKIVRPTEHPIAALLALDPNRRHTWNEFSEMLLLWDAYVSNAYAGVLRNNFGEPIELIPFQSGKVREYVEGRDVFYEVTASTMQEQALLGVAQKRFHERDMIHVRSRMIDGMDGYSTLIAGADVLATGDAMDDYREKLFSEDGQTRGVFIKKDDAPLDEIAFQRLRMQLKELMKRFKAGTLPIVLEGDMDFKSTSANPKDMEITKQFAEQITQVCRLMRVPPHKVFHMEGTKYENLETMEKAYVGDTLVPRAERFEHRYAKTLLSKKDRIEEYFLEYDRDEMTLRDSQRETERAKMLVERGALTLDELRAVFGYAEYPNSQGKVRLIPANMLVVDEHGKVVIEATKKPAGEGGENNEPPVGKDAPVLKVVRN